jgi:hypothetical protein
LEIKKENPPRKGGFPFASIIAILTGITSLLIFLTGKSNLPEIIKGETATNTPTHTPTVTLTAAADTPLPNLLSISTATQDLGNDVVPTLSVLIAHPPTDADLDSVPSLWTLTKFQELDTPSSNAYTVQVTHDSVYLWDCYFCATHDAFVEFMNTVDVEFLIDDTPLKTESLRIFDRPGISGWLCRDWTTILSGWPADRSVFLEIRYTHSKTAFDGKAEFAPGEYNQTIVVVVKG